MPSPRAILVEPDHDYASRLVTSARSVGWDTVVHDTFAEARQALAKATPDVLVSNIRLGAFNGIQLAYLTRASAPGAGIILYSPIDDHVLVREARNAGAFYEPMAFAPYALPAYLTARLPVGDRRQSVSDDRRRNFRGGRRSTDIAALRGAAYSA